MKVTVVAVFLKMPLLVTLPVKVAGAFLARMVFLALLVTLPLMVVGPPVKVVLPLLVKPPEPVARRPKPVSWALLVKG